MTRFLNHILFAALAAIGVLAALPTNWLAFVPAKYKPVVEGSVMAAAWIKSHKNLLINPDGTSALTAWVREDDKKVQSLHSSSD